MKLLDHLNIPAVSSASVLPDDQDQTQVVQPIGEGQGVNVDSGVVEQKSVVKPESLNWMTDDEYKDQLNHATPDQIERVYSTFDPKSAEPFYQNVYKATQRMPTEPDEKRVRAANTIAGVTDALSMLAQGVTGAKDGLIPVVGSTAVGSNARDVKRLRDIYKAERDRYDAGLFSSTMRDIELARQGHSADKANLLNVLNNSRRLKNAKDIVEAKNEQEKWKYGVERDRWQTEQEEKIRHNKEMESVAKRNADASVIRASRTGVRYRSTTSDGTRKDRLEFFDPSTGSTYKVNEKKFNANAPQLFNILKEDIIASDPKLAKEYRRTKGKISLQEQNDAVKKYMLHNPEAVKFLERISDEVTDDASLIELPELSDDTINAIDSIAGQHSNNDDEALRQIAVYLRQQGYNQADIKNILKSIQ